MNKRAALSLIGLLLALIIVMFPVNAENSPPETTSETAFEETTEETVQESTEEAAFEDLWDALIDLEQMISDMVCVIQAMNDEIDQLRLQNIWIHPLVAYPIGPGGPSTTMVTTGMCNTSRVPCMPGALEITANTVVSDLDEQWIIFPFAVPDGASITGVRINYYVNASDPSITYISATRLTQMTAPDVAYVMMDDETDLTGPGPFDHTSYASYTVEGATQLDLKVVIGNPADSIVIGGIEVYMQR